MTDISGYFYIYPTYIDSKKKMYGLGFICCPEKDSAMKNLTKKGYFDYIDFEDPCIFIFITEIFNFFDFIEKNPFIPFIIRDSQIIYFLDEEISLKTESKFKSEIKMNFIPRFLDPGFTMNPLRQLIISEDKLEEEEKICLLLYCDMKLMKSLQSKKHEKKRIYLEKQAKKKIEKFYRNSMELYYLKLRESRLKLVLHYEKTLRKILGVLPSNPRGPASTFSYFVGDLEEEKIFKRSVSYFRPNCLVGKIEIEFIIDAKTDKQDMIREKLEYYLNRKRNHLEIYSVQLRGEYGSTRDDRFQRIKYEISVDFHWDSPDIFNLGEFFDHLIERFESGVKEVDITSFERFISRTPRELWIKEILLIIETPEMFADTIIESLKRHCSQIMRFNKQELLDRTIIKLTFSYFEPEDYLDTGEGIFNLIQKRPIDLFSRIAVDWALDGDFKKSSLFAQKALFALVADFLFLVDKDNGVKRDAMNVMSEHIFSVERKRSGELTAFETEKVNFEGLQSFELIMKNIKEIKKNYSTKRMLHSPNEKHQAEARNAVKDLLLSMSRDEVFRKEAAKMARMLYSATGVALENKSFEHAPYSKLENQFDVARALVENLKWQRRIGFLEEGMFFRNEARELVTENYDKYLLAMGKSSELIKQSTIPLVRDFKTFEDDLAILYTYMMRDLQRKFPEKTQGWIWGIEY